MTVLNSNGWDRQTRRPSIQVPDGAWDTHFHVYGKGLATTDRTYDPPAAGLDDILRVHDALGIARGVVVQPTVYGTDHTQLCEVLRLSRGRFRGIAIVNDSVCDSSLMELARSGVCGARFNFLAQLGFAISQEEFERSTRRIAELGWITVVHGTAQELMDRATWLEDVATPVVIDHMAHWDLNLDWQRTPTFDFLRRMLDRGNFWMKLSNGDRISRAGRDFHDVIPLAQAFIAAAPERVIWGTDWPHILYRGSVPNDGTLVELCGHYAANAATLQRILVSNPEALFGP
ncbi:MAG: amidohydrolase family protein [Pigmentiphaga sp.]